MLNNAGKYNGYVVYSNVHTPLGVVSINGERMAICNMPILPSKLKQYLIDIEDQRFYQHVGLDIKGILRAIVENLKIGKVVQGGSTITQQLARNILRDNRKSIIRKLKELLITVKLENQYGKDKILELYFNKVFWGKRIYGLRAASLEYFSKEPEQLSTAEQLALLTFLRGPNYYLRNETKFLERYALLGQILYKRRVLSIKKLSKIKKAAIQIGSNNLEIFRHDTVPYITRTINEKHHSIITTLDRNFQRETTRFISSCKYPTSIVCIAKGQIIAVASSNGTDYPFTFKSNVGSTLKPFIYTFLRENGVSRDDVFATTNTHNLNWDIREVKKSNKPFLTLKEALLLSNNNVFVNASYQIGIENVLSFLAKTLNKPAINFVPASVLGATIDGITLHELATAYYRFFLNKPDNVFKKECTLILDEIAAEKLGRNIFNVFLKTGTTNNSKERYGIVGTAKMLFAFLRQGNETDDYTKEGNFLTSIMRFLRNVRSKIYKWE